MNNLILDEAVNLPFAQRLGVQDAIILKDDQLKLESAVKEIIQQNAIQLKRLQDEITKLSDEVKRLEQYETFYKLLKEVRSI